MRAYWLILCVAVAGCTKPPLPPNRCELPTAVDNEVPAGTTKFAMSLFHYNIQYVVGGLAGFDDEESFCGLNCDGWDNEAVEDWIVRESFVPVVDFYLENPSWRANFEMQAYMLEVLAERFPEVVPKLRTLVERGQIELSSFHYADQLFLAYPRADLKRSIQLTRDVFEEVCLPLSPVVFNQEGQAGEGWLALIGEEPGYEIGVFPKNLFRYARGSGAQAWPLSERDGVMVVPGSGGVDPQSGIELQWPFFGDGELLAVEGDLNPYFAPFVGYAPDKLDAFADRHRELEALGFESVRISDYVRHLQAEGFEIRPLPPVLDGTWQAPSTDSIHRWLGGMGEGPWSHQEMDNRVRAGNYEARTLLDAAQVIADAAGATERQEALDAMWRDMMHAQVSDSSGVNPWAAEIQWSVRLNERIVSFAEDLIATLKAQLGYDFVAIDLNSRTITGLSALPSETLLPVAAPLAGVTADGQGRALQMSWLQVGDVSDSRFRLEVAFEASTDDDRVLTVSFPRLEERLRYSPGLIEDAVTDHPLSDFVLDWGGAYLPLANGVIGLGDSWWVVKHARRVHIAARIPTATATIEFIDETQPAAQAVTWVFEVLSGTAGDALELGRALNTAPVVYR